MNIALGTNVIDPRVMADREKSAWLVAMARDYWRDAAKSERTGWRYASFPVVRKLWLETQQREIRL